MIAPEVQTEMARPSSGNGSRGRSPSRVVPRLGFLGVGWIGRNRMEAIARSGLGDIVAIADAVEANAIEAGKLALKAERVTELEELLAMDLDGVVIATPSA